MHGNTALMRAAVMSPEARALSECKCLCACGAQVDVSNDSGNTALMLAIMGGNIETAIYLQSQGANPWRKNNDGVNAVDLAREYFQRTQSMNRWIASQLLVS